jgi:hypothetical protein
MATKLVGHRIEECGVLVRGTDDPRRARTEALRVLMDRHSADLYPTFWQDHPHEWAETALHYARRLRDLTPSADRLWRWTPCSPVSCYDGGGHLGHLTEAAQPGRGVFRAVYWWEVY